ncbi:hypothetical protein E2C01_025757 [Portunus trituberculatus]|uniref:Uncharacterized protein n=1 Tax=Portunus trituberculatus TaxID=210409 RepID=A0A5B7EGZ5_PORTR|nr:hypothetical protein [Portunus trituberculatus]
MLSERSYRSERVKRGCLVLRVTERGVLWRVHVVLTHDSRNIAPAALPATKHNDVYTPGQVSRGSPLRVKKQQDLPRHHQQSGNELRTAIAKPPARPTNVDNWRARTALHLLVIPVP